jgi:hypothetical protein
MSFMVWVVVMEYSLMDAARMRGAGVPVMAKAYAARRVSQ